MLMVSLCLPGCRGGSGGSSLGRTIGVPAATISTSGGTAASGLLTSANLTVQAQVSFMPSRSEGETLQISDPFMDSQIKNLSE